MRDTRGDILREAEILIRARGYSGVSYADLSAAVGIRKASIHHYFPVKADLALALLAFYDERYDRLMAEILASTQDGLARIHAYSDLYLDGVEKGLGCLCAAFSAELETLPSDLRSELTRFFAKHLGWIERVLEAGRENGTVRAGIIPGPFARTILAALEGALMMERLLDGPLGFANVFAEIERALKPG